MTDKEEQKEPVYYEVTHSDFFGEERPKNMGIRDLISECQYCDSGWRIHDRMYLHKRQALLLAKNFHMVADYMEKGVMYESIMFWIDQGKTAEEAIATVKEHQERVLGRGA